MVNSKDWNILAAVQIGTHQTLGFLLEELPDSRVDIPSKRIRDYEIQPRQQEVRLVAIKVCRLGFEGDSVSAKQAIERGLKYPSLTRSPAGSLVRLRQQYCDQPVGNTCVGSHDPIGNGARLTLQRLTCTKEITIGVHSGPLTRDHWIIFEAYRDS